MVFNILKQFNWLDIVILLLIFRVIYISIKGGFTTELFKLLGIICAIYLAMHYYMAVADFIRGKLPVEEKVPLEFLDFLVFVVLAVLGNLFFVLLRNAVNNLIKIEAVSTLNKWGGLVLGGFRSILLVSLVLFSLVISSVPYLKNSARSSYFGPRILSTAVNTYTWVWGNISSKFASSEKQNSAVIEVKEWMGSK